MTVQRSIALVCYKNNTERHREDTRGVDDALFFFVAKFQKTYLFRSLETQQGVVYPFKYRKEAKH